MMKDYNAPSASYDNYNVYSAAPQQMWSGEQEKCPPPCHECNKKCFKIFARIFFKKEVENYCTKECWDKHVLPR